MTNRRAPRSPRTPAGRVYYGDLASALDAFTMPAQRRAVVHTIVEHVAHDAIWIPPSGGYVALAHQGRIRVSIHRTFVDTRVRCGGVIRSSLSAAPGSADHGRRS